MCWCRLIFFSFLLIMPSQVFAHSYDISLRGLGRPGIGDDSAAQRFRGLTTELAFAIAPRPLASAETLGSSGFEFALASTTSGISSDQDYWKGQPGWPVFEGSPELNQRKVPTLFWVPTLHIRKGLPMSTEIGVIGNYVAFSEMYLLGMEGKIALHEAYHRWIPALSVRGALGRLFGNDELNLTTFEVDALTSLSIGLFGLLEVTPYIGFGYLFVQASSNVLDETPFEVINSDDQQGGSQGSLYAFGQLKMFSNRHNRLLGGLRINISMFEILYEFNAGFLKAPAQTQLSHSIKIGFDI